mmetsp:Transcript_77860/g.90894  ORF Transcript_77860/g.90894 Transcript_77860/m.90894 type:complete len:133 (-) Transcript_77860:52-450(-)
MEFMLCSAVRVNVDGGMNERITAISPTRRAVAAQITATSCVGMASHESRCATTRNQHRLKEYGTCRQQQGEPDGDGAARGDEGGSRSFCAVSIRRRSAASNGLIAARNTNPATAISPAEDRMAMRVLSLRAV